MRISRIKVNNFKSLVDFDLPMEKFTCLIGLNGSGKSTVLQFLDFLGQLMTRGFGDWCNNRGWYPPELQSHQLATKELTATIWIEDDSPEKCGTYEFCCDIVQQQCTREKLRFGEQRFELEHSKYSTNVDPNAVPIHFFYLGSILSQLLDNELPERIREFRDWLRSTHSLDTLTADYIRQPSGAANGSLGHGGRNLATYYAKLDFPQQERIKSALRDMYPKFTGIVVAELPLSRQYQLEVCEQYPVDAHLFGGTKATHVNDGLLRVFAILAELFGKHDFVLLDEIENGINPEVVEFLVDKLVNARQQVMVTTHSPMILNYIEDEVAKKSVVYLYKTDAGHTKAIRFFDIPSMAEKLKVMGPGEVFVDTKLSALADEIAALPNAGAP